MTAADRKIIHVDMDAFYASIEQRDRPELKGKPVLVGGDPSGRGVVAAASYEARRFGVRSAMSAAKAKRLCPQAVFVRPDFSKYVAVSRQIQEVFRSVTTLVEPLSLDEAYLDVTQNLLAEPLARTVALHIKDRIRKETGLTASAGVGPNKFIAKVASDLRKPDGLVVVPPAKVAEFVKTLAVERFWGVGPKTAARLHKAGVFTAADVRARSVEELQRVVGSYASFFRALAFGEDDREVESDGQAKSCGTETTFAHDILDTNQLLGILEEQADEIAAELKKKMRPGRTVTLKLRYADFKTITRSRTLLRPTTDARLIARTACELLGNTDAGSRPARLIGVSVSQLISEDEPIQLWLDLPLD